MTNVEVFCDRCGKQIKINGWAGITNKFPKRISAAKLAKDRSGKCSYSNWDGELCEDCYKSLEDWFRRRT